MAERAQPHDVPARPRRTARTITLVVMAVTLIAAAALALSLGGEARYALTDSTAVDVGTLLDADLAPHRGRYVRASAELAGKPAVAFRRPFERDGYRVAYAGNRRWVVYRVPEELAGPRFVPPARVAGRVVPASELGVRFRGLADAMASAGELEGGWVLVDGERPQSAGWVAGLVALLGVFALWNAASIVRVVRRVPVR